MDAADTAPWHYRASAAPRSGYLRLALLVSICLHAGLLALRFSSPERPTLSAPTLDVTLVNARTETAPIQPQVLAQDQINAGGDANQGVASSPLPRTAQDTPDLIVLAALRKRQHELEAEQQALLTQLEARDSVAAARKAPDLFQESSDPGQDNRSEASLILNARISALKERIQQYNARPRQQFVGPSAQAAPYAQYVENWRKKIELLGTEHYPPEARGTVYGKLRLTVYIRSNGDLDRVQINSPSEHAVLNLAAQRIVQLAAPFAPLPPEIAQETDVLAITRTWHFTNNALSTESQ